MLRELRVAARTATRYKDALDLFFSWLVAQHLFLPQIKDELDIVTSEYIEALWQEGEGRNRAADTLSAIQ